MKILNYLISIEIKQKSRGRISKWTKNPCPFFILKNSFNTKKSL